MAVQLFYSGEMMVDGLLVRATTTLRLNISITSINEKTLRKFEDKVQELNSDLSGIQVFDFKAVP